MGAGATLGGTAEETLKNTAKHVGLVAGYMFVFTLPFPVAEDEENDK